MSRLDVAELIERCLQGDGQAQAEFYTEYHRLIERAITRKLVRSVGAAAAQSDVEDIRHEVFERLLGDNCSRLRRLKKPQSIDAWLITVAGNHTIDYLRQRARETRLHASMAHESHEPYYTSPADEAMADERNRRLAERFAELSDQDRLILDLFFVQGLRYAQLAEVLGLNINTASARLRRAKAKLRRLLEEDRCELP